MPNGGVPLHMVLHPSQGGLVIYCEGGSVKLFTNDDWKARRRDAEPVAVLSQQDAAALAWFIRYWLGEPALKPGYQMRGAIRAEFDF